MFCPNCGKQNENNVLFCAHCGGKVGNTSKLKSSYDKNKAYVDKPNYDMSKSTPDVNLYTGPTGTSGAGYGMSGGMHAGMSGGMSGYNGAHMGMGMSMYSYNAAKIVWIVLSALSTLLVAFASIMPVMSVMGDNYTISYIIKRVIELMDALNDNKYLWRSSIDKDTIDGLGVLLLICFLATAIFFLINLLCSLAAWIYLLKGKSGEDVTRLMTTAMTSGLGHILCPVIMGVIFNISAEYTIFYPSVWGWIVMVIASLNLMVFIRGYLGKDIFGIPTVPQPMGMMGNYAGVKICQMCNTEFPMGNCCPRCGSYSVRDK